ncbi:MAG: hypothetical protein AB8F94_25455 [Saprospiraceae bacterium]
MKNQILDEPIKQEIVDLLEKEETILWKGTPNLDSLKSSFFLVFLFFSFPIGFILLYSYAIGFFEQLINILYLPIIGLIILLVIILSINYSKQLKRKRTQYFITQKQILFQFKKLGKKEIHSIPFSEIDNIQVVDFDPYADFEDMEKEDLIGTIFLSVKNPKLIPFQTFDFRTREKRAQPTLELINTKKATQLIRQGIQQNN